MAYKQLVTPNLGVVATRGWCLKYVDDAVGAQLRQYSAQASYDVEHANGNTRAEEPPVGLWVPIYFSLNKGPYAGLGHVAWAFNHGGGWIEIHDSETRCGARPTYRSITEVLAWFGNYDPRYLGWSVWVDGVQAVEEFTPPPTPDSGLKPAKGTATVLVDTLNVRNEPSTNSAVVAQYSKGQKFVYDNYCVANGYVWLSYISYSGVRRYVAEGPADNDPNNVYVSGGVSR